ncbi:MAG: EthD domain-containing protein [Kofleriaceae bacterium]
MSDFLTLVMPLQKRADITVDDFYDYWLNAHITLPARFPGIDSIFLHMTSFDQQRFPRVPNTSHRPEERDDFQGVPEATFAAQPDLQVFIDAATVQWQDGINFLREEISYRGIGGNSQTVIDRLPQPAPDGNESHVRHLVFLRKRPAVETEAARAFVTGALVPAWSKADKLLKLRSHLFEVVEGTLDHPGVQQFKPIERQYQACVEVVFPDETAQDAFASSQAWRETTAGLGEHFEAVHAVRATRTITSKYKGQITLAGARGVQVADIIHKLNAKSQTQDACTALFVNDQKPHMSFYHSK